MRTNMYRKIKIVVSLRKMNILVCTPKKLPRGLVKPQPMSMIIQRLNK